MSTTTPEWCVEPPRGALKPAVSVIRKSARAWFQPGAAASAARNALCAVDPTVPSSLCAVATRLSGNAVGSSSGCRRIVLRSALR
jgi:hypothetical protein